MAFDKKYQIASDEVMEKFSKELSDQLKGYTAVGLEDAMDESLDLIQQSMEKYVPEDTAATKRSWFQEVKTEKGKITGIFGHDKEGELDYIPYIYLGYTSEGSPINFHKGRRALWLEPAARENLDAIKRKLSNSGGNR